ncbi:bifunctional methylenetetrahydrofolate dehydrogenase/methenyltetrahydrofolate cyclohydrolase FolD [Robbsia sp. KACC 23696]|uniref:bifunctional 5,10-methylenetetrahydrofolate dehydrogenase/5,10-methenyltetrahydrofolate cyclohydrolase n=1 Tax=Robbsia sp. KACC 23696 TaxID=3149231 RepID=UPI00325B5F52
MRKVIDGKQIARELIETVTLEVRGFRERHGLAPALAVILVGEDPASDVYVRQKVKQCDVAGIRSVEYRLPKDTDEPMLRQLIHRLNSDKTVHGILVQLPLPAHIDAAAMLDAIDPGKDVDGFHPVNMGRLSSGNEGLTPCTPLGCLMLLDTVIDELRGKHAVVIGKSNIVGKPVAMLLLERECTVTVTHIATRGLPDIVRHADIVVAAAGSPSLVRGDWIKRGAVVIDVGITRVQRADGKTVLVGDCAIEEMAHAAAVTPVPGGVGPMTIACLLANTLKAARMSFHG